MAVIVITRQTASNDFKYTAASCGFFKPAVTGFSCQMLCGYQSRVHIGFQVFSLFANAGRTVSGTLHQFLSLHRKVCGVCEIVVLQVLLSLDWKKNICFSKSKKNIKYRFLY